MKKTLTVLVITASLWMIAMNMNTQNESGSMDRRIKQSAISKKALLREQTACRRGTENRL